MEFHRAILFGCVLILLGCGKPSPYKFFSPPVFNFPLSDGTYKAEAYHADSVTPGLQSITLNSGTYVATFMTINAFPVVSSGTFTYSSMSGLVLKQESLYLTPAPGQASQINCQGITLSDGVASDVSGRTCDGTALYANGDTIATFLYQMNEVAIGNCNLDITHATFIPPIFCAFDLYYSLVLQTPLPGYANSTPPTDGVYVAPRPVSFPGFIEDISAQPDPSTMIYTTNMEAITIFGNHYWVSVSIDWGPDQIYLGEMISAGVYTMNSTGSLSFTQQSAVFTAAGDEEFCGMPLHPGENLDVAGLHCSTPVAQFQPNGATYDSTLTAVSATAISPCPSTYVNCQFDSHRSYTLY